VCLKVHNVIYGHFLCKLSYFIEVFRYLKDITMASAQFQKLRSDVTKKLHEPNSVNNILGKIEGKTGVDRFFIVTSIAALFSLYLIFGHFAELVCNFIGFLYPAYISIKAIESATKADDTQWLTYWVVFGFFSILEFAEDEIIEVFPIYWLCKCAFLVYLYLPMTMGAQKIYIKAIRPAFTKYQQTIEARFGKTINKTNDALKETAQSFKQH